MNCFRCNEQKTVAHQLFCPSCQAIVTQQEQAEQDAQIAKEKRWREQSRYTALYFCSACGIELFRYSHIRRRTHKLMDKIGQSARLAGFKHVQSIQHPAQLIGPVLINELSGDDEFEVQATGLPEDKCLSHTQASRVMRELGIMR